MFILLIHIALGNVDSMKTLLGWSGSFPKNMSFKTVDANEIAFAQDRLNIRPRKTLGFQSPVEVFFKKSTVAFGT